MKSVVGNSSHMMLSGLKHLNNLQRVAWSLRSRNTTPRTMASTSAGKAHTNRLANEQSPYLQQHKHNPVSAIHDHDETGLKSEAFRGEVLIQTLLPLGQVDWFPWGQEAFQKAKAEDKPIFLSIGYATCHCEYQAELTKL